MTNDEELLDAYARDQRRRNLSPNGIRRRRLVLKGFLRSLPEGVGLLEATHTDVEDWLDGRRIVARTRYSYISTAAAFYDWAVRDERTVHDPTRRIQRPKLPRLLPRPMGDADLSVALDLADDRMRCFLLLAAYEGLRCMEIGQLRREHILDSQDPAVILVYEGKGGHERAVPLHPEVAEALHRYGMPARAGWLFPGKRGGLQAQTISKYVSDYLRSIGVGATAHRGRHWFGTHTYRSSRDLRMVQELMGHANSSTTAGYTLVEPGESVPVVQGLNCRQAAKERHPSALGVAGALRDAARTVGPHRGRPGDDGGEGAGGGTGGADGRGTSAPRARADQRAVAADRVAVRGTGRSRRGAARPGVELAPGG